MEKPSVMIRHKEGYAAAAVLFSGAILAFFLNMLLPSAQQEERILGYAIAGMAVAVALIFLLWARCTETIDESGICIKRPFLEKQYPWDAVKCVGIVPPSGKDLPKIEIHLADRRSPLLIDYTKQSLSCIQFYYGEPDSDKWGRPPALT